MKGFHGASQAEKTAWAESSMQDLQEELLWPEPPSPAHTEHLWKVIGDVLKSPEWKGSMYHLCFVCVDEQNWEGQIKTKEVKENPVSFQYLVSPVSVCYRQISTQQLKLPGASQPAECFSVHEPSKETLPKHVKWALLSPLYKWHHYSSELYNLPRLTK